MPFTLAECEKFYHKKGLVFDRYDQLQAYMVTGGIPYYMSYFQKGLSLAQNIDKLFFSLDGELSDEFGMLYASLFKNPEPYIKVVNTLGTKRIGMTRDEIITYGDLQDNGRLTEILDDLVECGFIRKYNAWGQKTKNGLYQLIDSFTLFYYKYIQENVNNDEHFWSQQSGSPTYYNWCGLAFERVCLLHLPQIKKALGIFGTISNACSWHTAASTDGGNGAQIDLLIDRNDQVIDICEMKYTKEPYEMDTDEDQRIQNRRTRFISATQTDKAVHLILVSANGIKRNAYSDEFQAVLTAEDLFKE